MVYAIVVYDMEAERTGRLRKPLRRYLTHVQNSVFEGHLTEGELQEIKDIVDDVLKSGESAIVYSTSTEKILDRDAYGEDPADEKRFL